MVSPAETFSTESSRVSLESVFVSSGVQQESLRVVWCFSRQVQFHGNNIRESVPTFGHALLAQLLRHVTFVFDVVPWEQLIRQSCA